MRGAARLEVVGQGGDQLTQQTVSDAPTVAVLEHVDPGVARRDDKRRVRHDAVEALADDGREHVALAQLNAADVAQLEGQRGQLESAGAEVGRDDVGGGAARVQGLHAASRAEVEHTLGGARRNEAGERERGAAHPQHVVRAERAAAHHLAVVGDDPPVHDARVIDC